MEKQEYDFLLYDRIVKIQDVNKVYNLEKNGYVSFSGGKDSTILHYLIDLALPNNKIPRVYIDTGIEYNDVRNFVLELGKTDERILIIKSGINIKQMLENEGYPFKSKEHSCKLNLWQNGSRTKSVIDYIEKKNFGCPKTLKYQFTTNFRLKISDKCCFKLKKEPIHKWEKENLRPIAITGMRKNEGGQRTTLNCVLIDKNDNLIKFHPLAVVNEKFEDFFIKENNIQLCKLYYPPYNFKRTGCKGCPYSIDLQTQLNKMETFLPNEKKQCELIWKPIYKEYRRIKYRLKEQALTIFNFKP